MLSAPQRFWVLVSLWLSFVVSLCAAEAGCQFDDSADYLGGDLHVAGRSNGQLAGSKEECCLQCVDTEGCSLWTWERSSRQCWLKTHSAEEAPAHRTDSDECDSGVVFEQDDSAGGDAPSQPTEPLEQESVAPVETDPAETDSDAAAPPPPQPEPESVAPVETEGGFRDSDGTIPLETGPTEGAGLDALAGLASAPVIDENDDALGEGVHHIAQDDDGWRESYRDAKPKQTEETRSQEDETVGGEIEDEALVLGEGLLGEHDGVQPRGLGEEGDSKGPRGEEIRDASRDVHRRRVLTRRVLTHGGGAVKGARQQLHWLFPFGFASSSSRLLGTMLPVETVLVACAALLCALGVGIKWCCCRRRNVEAVDNVGRHAKEASGTRDGEDTSDAGGTSNGTGDDAAEAVPRRRMAARGASRTR